MATLAELQDALINADKAGDTDAARQLADAIHSMRQTEQAKPAAVQAGQTLAGIPRQLGLTARYALEGPAQAAEIVTEPLRQIVVNPALRALNPMKPQDLVTGYKPPQAGKLSDAVSSFADTIGLPRPEGANERVVGDATKLGFGGAGLAGASRRGAQATTGVASDALRMLGDKPVQQIVSAAGAGAAGGAVREAGGGPVSQGVAALLGGVAAPTALSAAQSGVNAARNLVGNRAPLEAVDRQIRLTIERAGMDWSQVPERVKQGMRAEVQQALNTGGELNLEAMRRLLDFQMVRGTRPTRGALTMDPVEITREQNLAKTGANSTDQALQRLPRIQNENAQALIRNIDDLGAANAPDAFDTGTRVIDSLDSVLRRQRGEVNSLYSQARDTSGRSAQLDGFAFTQRANQLLDEGLLGGALPPSVSSHLNRIAQGEVPFTVDYAEQLKTAIGKLQRASNDGQTRMALGTVRQALDDTPLRPARQVNPGNLPAVPGTVPPSPSVLGQESIDAFNAARRANRAMMAGIEANPALRAVDEGVQPDQFVKRFITGQSASLQDVRRLRDSIGHDQQALAAVRGNIASTLRDAMTGGSNEVTRVNAASFRKALDNIGDRKLSLFFSPEEVNQLRSIGRVAEYTTAQPTGSAVNNSNSGALIAARALDFLDGIAGRLPFGLRDTVQGTVQGVQQGRALNAPKSLLIPEPAPTLGERVGVPAIYGGLLLSQ